MSADSLTDLERELIALLRRAHSLGLAEGQRMTLSSFMQFASTALPDPVAASPRGEVATTPMRRERAPHGQVQMAVRKVVEAHPNGISQSEIISAGARAGLEIKPSSMRMALPALDKAGVIEFRDGKWFPKGNGAPSGTPLFNPQLSREAAATARKAGGT